MPLWNLASRKECETLKKKLHKKLISDNMVRDVKKCRRWDHKKSVLISSLVPFWGNLSTKQTELQKQKTNLWLLGVEGRIGGINWEIGIDIDTLLYIKWGFPGNCGMPANAGDMDSISGSGRYPGEENGNLFQYSCMENPVFLSGKSHGQWSLVGYIQSMGSQNQTWKSRHAHSIYKIDNY